MGAKRTSGKKKKSKSNFSFRKAVYILFGLIAAYFIFFYTSDYSPMEIYSLRRVESNYGQTIEEMAEKFNIPAEYLKALAMIECSGRKDMPLRYEEHVYQKLKEVQSGKRKKYENLTARKLKSLDDAGLKNLATSWGPFQIMGYKCLQMGAQVHNLRGDEAVYWGAKWINDNYGDLLRKGDFKNAFHMHNTGRRFPVDGVSQTFDPAYVSKGLHYVNYFKKNS